MDQYKPFLITKIAKNSGSIYVCCLCKKKELELWRVVIHQKTKCTQFIKKYPNAKNFKLQKALQATQRVVNRVENDKTIMQSLSTKANLSSNLSIFSHKQEERKEDEECQIVSSKNQKILPEQLKSKDFLPLKKHPKTKPTKKSSEKVTLVQEQQTVKFQALSELKIDPQSFQFRMQNGTYIYPPSELISKRSFLLIQSFQILSPTKPTIFLEEFREYLEIYRFDRHSGAFESSENTEYKQRVRNTLFSLFKLHFTDKRKFVLITADKRILMNFCWRNDIPEVSIVGSMNTFGKQSIYKDLIKDSNSFKFKTQMCVITKGQKEALRVWRYIASIFDEPLPFTVLSNHSFEGAYKYIPVIVDDIEQIQDSKYIFDHNLTKQIFKLRILGYSLPHTLYSFSMAIGDKLKCIIDVNMVEQSIVLQELKNSPDREEERKE